jgi:hypothetical protein
MEVLKGEIEHYNHKASKHHEQYIEKVEKNKCYNNKGEFKGTSEMIESME